MPKLSAGLTQSALPFTNLAISAAGNGTTDDRTALLAAIGIGLPVHLSGKTYRVGSQISTTVPVRLVGPGTLLFDFVSDTSWFSSADVLLHDVILDGNNVSNELLRTTDSANLVMRGGAVQNVFNTSVNGTAGMRMHGGDSVFEDVLFQHICTPKNDVFGDSEGSARAVQLRSGRHKFHRCRFIDINNRATAGGTKQYEDSDSISLNNTCSALDVTKCYFEDAGKRFLKINGDVPCRTRVKDCDFLSSYTGTVDDFEAVGNGMESAIALFNGALEVEGCRWLGGIVGSFISLNTANATRVLARDNDIRAEHHSGVNTSYTRFISFDPTVPTTCTVEVDGNTVDGFHYGVRTQSKMDSIIFRGNKMATLDAGLLVGSGAKSVIATGNRFRLSTGTTSSGVASTGVWISDVTDKFVVRDNIGESKYSVVTIIDQTGSYKGIVKDNIGEAVSFVVNDYTTTTPASLSISGNVEV